MKRFLPSIFIISFLAISAAAVMAGGQSPEVINDPTGFSILEAGENGSFNMGPAMGDVVPETDKELNKKVFKFDYTIYSGSIVGLWTKKFPSKFGPGLVDAVRAGAKATNTEQLKQVSVKLEIKGKNAVQTIPLSLEEKWTYVKSSVDWARIGELNEVVFVISPKDAGKRLDGILYFDLNFYKLTFLEKYLALIKALIVIGFSLMAAFLVYLFGMLAGGRRRGNAEAAKLSGIWRDLLYGIAAVLIIGGTLSVFSLGTKNPLDTGLTYGFLGIAFVGLMIAQLLKSGLSGRSLTPQEAFYNALVSGMLAASSGRMELLQAPSSWVQTLVFSNLLAALAFVIYHIVNAKSLASTGRHLRFISGSLIAGTPYIFNWLLLVENVNLLKSLTDNVTFGLLAAWPVILIAMGRTFVVFIFNEMVANGIGLLTRDRPLKTARAHTLILMVSLGVVIAPLIADLGSIAKVGSLPMIWRMVISIATTMLSYAGLWGEVYLITGILLDGGHLTAPSSATISKHVNIGMKKGMAYSGILVAILYAIKMLIGSGASQKLMSAYPILIGIVSGAAIFPLLKTIIESFDGSLPFFERTRYSYKDGSLYGRGAIVGAGFAYALTKGFIRLPMSERILFGLIVGLLASGGVSILRDMYYALRRQGKVHSWKLYLVDSLLGAFVGSAAAFYMDTLQVPVIVEKFKFYTSSGFAPIEYTTYPLVNKWGRIDLGTYTGGVKLLFNESLAGVINWSIAAWLFAINKVFMQAYFEKDKTPIKFFFSKAGFAQLIEHMIYVLRWGLWMSPIIFTGLRMMPDPTWYNQDGAIRTLFAIYNNIAMTPEAFRAWSLQVFIYIMAFDIFRILIWMDHMGLRVATLVNLSFLGLDRLDERIARFIGPAAAQRYIPDAVKRFATWAPLLIPFYIPRGREWDQVWNTSEAMQAAAAGRKGLVATIESMPINELLVLAGVLVLIFTGISCVGRALRRRYKARHIEAYEIDNRDYKVTAKSNGEIFSEATVKECDVSRRAYDQMDPCGRILYLVDSSGGPGMDKYYWPVAGNFPQEKFEASIVEKRPDSLRISNSSYGIRTTIDITIPPKDDTIEIWEVTLENVTSKARHLKVVPYLEWVLVGGIHDRFHTQYARLYPQMEYVSSANSILAWQKSSKSMGILASDIAPEGILTSRVDFIGRARSVWSPRIFETFDFLPPEESAAYPTFDPIGSLLVNVPIAAKSSAKMRLAIGYAKDRNSALGMIEKYLKPRPSKSVKVSGKKRPLLIGHGEMPPGTPQPYFEYADNGNKLLVHTPYTPRPVDHAMSNAIHSVMVTNRGLHTSSNGNSQQNRLTPDWPDIVTKEVPTEAIYIYDENNEEWYSPTYQPLNDASAKYESEFSIDGTALFLMKKGSISTELTVFVPPEDPLGIYLLNIKNSSGSPRRLKVAPYFQMVLAFQPERAGPLEIKRDGSSGTLYFRNPRNTFRTGWAFVSMTAPAELTETKRGRFFGKGASISHPFLVEKCKSDTSSVTDPGQIASFLTTLEIPAHGEATIAVALGQTDDMKSSAALVKKYKDIETVKKSLDSTRKWWTRLMATVSVKTNQPEFDTFQNWLKYQALAERIWARRGFYQTSGAYGFRDQLQDTVNLIWVDPALARKQIILHASQQFLEGDVFHWFFTLTDGRTAFSCRSHASDNPLWLVWGVVEYIRTTGDTSILNEMASYMVSQFPFARLPKNKQGWGHLYHRSTKSDSVYKHCMKSIDLVLKRRMGRHGLPLMGTGDWNDGLDEIGSEGKGESVWLAFFLYYILKEMVDIIEMKEGKRRKEHYVKRMEELKDAIEKTWRTDRYLRAIHDDGTEIGVKGSGVWEIDALTAAWAVMSGINLDRAITIFTTALDVLEKDNAILLGWPALREDTKPYLGRSSKYPEGVRENGMYCHGVQWLIRAARILAEHFDKSSDKTKADEYRKIAYRLWLKVSPIPRAKPEMIELYGGQPNKQSADILTTFDCGRMIWHGYTGAAGWMLRQALEGVIGASLVENRLVLPPDLDKPRGELKVNRVERDIEKSPLRTR